MDAVDVQVRPAATVRGTEVVMAQSEVRAGCTPKLPRRTGLRYLPFVDVLEDRRSHISEALKEQT